MHDFLMVKDSELWDIVLNGPYIPIAEVKKVKSQELFQRPVKSMMKLIVRRLRKATKPRSY